MRQRHEEDGSGPAGTIFHARSALRGEKRQRFPDLATRQHQLEPRLSHARSPDGRTTQAAPPLLDASDDSFATARTSSEWLRQASRALQAFLLVDRLYPLPVSRGCDRRRHRTAPASQHTLRTQTTSSCLERSRTPSGLTTLPNTAQAESAMFPPCPPSRPLSRHQPLVDPPPLLPHHLQGALPHPDNPSRAPNSLPYHVPRVGAGMCS